MGIHRVGPHNVSRAVSDLVYGRLAGGTNSSQYLLASESQKHPFFEINLNFFWFFAGFSQDGHIV